MNNDILESEEFNNLMEMACTAATKNEVNIVAAKIKSLIRNHYTPKTVEENETDLSEYILMKISDEYPYMIFESKAKDGTIVAEPIKEMLCFRGSKSECEAEKKRLESLTKGREESKIICMGEAFGRARCPVDCQNCIDMDEEHESASLRAQPTPNRDNYRAELLSLAATIAAGLEARSDFSEINVMTYLGRPSERYKPEYWSEYANKYSFERAKSILAAIDKEVKSNPASE